MKKFIFCVVAFCLPALLAFAQAPGWVNFESKESGFKVLFPEAPKTSEDAVETEIGKLNIKFFTCDLYTKDSIVYMALVTSYPADKISSDKKEIVANVFRNAIDGGVKNVSGTLLSEKELTFKQYPGREFKMSFQDGAAIISARAYLVKNTMYMLQAITVKDKENEPGIKRFLDSFTLLSR
jgi:hypothetical protein